MESTRICRHSKCFAPQNEILAAFGFFVFFMLCQAWFIHVEEYWDAKAYIMPFTEHVFRHYPDPFISEYPDPGHPTLIYFATASLWKMWGVFSQNVPRVEIFHLVLMFCSAMNLYYVYRLGRHLDSVEVGLVSAILLFFNPIYFSQSTQIGLEIPLTLFITASYFYYIMGRRLAFVLSGIGLVLTKGYAMVFYLPIVLEEFYRTITRRSDNAKASDIVRRWIFISLPLLVLALFIIARYAVSGVFLSSRVYSHHRQFAVSLGEFVQNLVWQIKFLFGGYGVYYVIIPPLLYFLVLAYRKILKKPKANKSEGSNTTISKRRDVLRLVFLYASSCLLLCVYLALVGLRIPRYYLFMYTPLFILATHCAFKIAGRGFAYGIFGLMLLYSLINFHPRVFAYLPITFMKVNKHYDISLGDNLEYIDNLKLIRVATEYVKQHYAGAKIIGDYPFNQYLYGMDFQMPGYPEVPDLKPGERYVYIYPYVAVYNPYLKDEFAKRYRMREVKTFWVDQACVRIYVIDVEVEGGT